MSIPAIAGLSRNPGLNLATSTRARLVGVSARAIPPLTTNFLHSTITTDRDFVLVFPYRSWLAHELETFGLELGESKREFVPDSKSCDNKKKKKEKKKKKREREREREKQ